MDIKEPSTLRREAIIRDYIDGYNHFDIDKMISDMDDEIVFKNISGDAVNLSLTGKKAFQEQAVQAKHYFLERTQTITSIMHKNNEAEVEVDYTAVLATDLPGGLKKGEMLELKGRSIFTFSGSRIIALTDIS